MPISFQVSILAVTSFCTVPWSAWKVKSLIFGCQDKLFDERCFFAFFITFERGLTIKNRHEIYVLGACFSPQTTVELWSNGYGYIRFRLYWRHFLVRLVTIHLNIISHIRFRIYRMKISVLSDLMYSRFTVYLVFHPCSVINLVTNKCVRMLGKPENARLLQLGLFQGGPRKLPGVVTYESEASDNPALQNMESDPSLFCTAYKKNRFYIFSKRQPYDTNRWGNM